MKHFKLILALLFWALCLPNISAQEKPQQLTLPSVIGDNMVLQQNATVNIWGWAKPKSKVSVCANWDSAKPVIVKTNGNGAWIAQIATPEASFTPMTITISSGKDVYTLKNILIGEVWLCSGQSNMQFKVKQSTDLKKDLKKEMNHNIRLYNTGRIYSDVEKNDIDTKWVECNATDLAEFSAIGYGFGKELQKKLNVPIGLICASYGGTFIEGWLKASVIESDPKIVADCNAIKHKTWTGKESQLYNANIYPIRFTTIAGVIWYQGCANVASRPRNYAHTLEVLVNSWREEFRNPQMPFYIVQIAPHTYANIKGAQVREAQSRVADKLDHCEVVITNDQQEIPGDIHPRIKATIAHRLASCALGEHYGDQSVIFRSPAFESMSVEGSSIRIRLKNIPNGLLASGNRINGFQIGENNLDNPKHIDFRLAEASIQPDNSILVYADSITSPVAVRYCFNEDIGNIFSAEGLPLAPFRTDKNNTSLGSRPYVEKPSEISITFEGKDYEKSCLKKGEHMWTNLKQTLSDEYPKEFEGFEMLTNKSVKQVLTDGGKITAHGDGRIYCIVRNTNDMLNICKKHGWRLIVPAWLKAVTPAGKKIATQYIAYKEVKEGDIVELPKVKDHYSVFVLAKSIDYKPIE